MTFAVKHLNSLNEALPWLERLCDGAEDAPVSFAAIIATTVAVEDNRLFWRVSVAHECAPWFDDSAFERSRAA